MEKLNFSNNVLLRLPPGFRFVPTDEELLVHYLRRKVLSYPLPADIIPEAEVCRLDPWDLPGDLENERYFFSRVENKYPNGKRPNRATLSGYWKASGLDKQIWMPQIKRVIGAKKTLVFYRGKPPTGTKTNWIMHEYRLSEPIPTFTQGTDKWVVSRIFLKKRGRNGGEKEGEEWDLLDDEDASGPIFYDFLGAVSSTTSSGLTSVDGSVEGEEEEMSEFRK